MHLVPHMQDFQDGYLGIALQGPKETGKSTLYQYMFSYCPPRDAKGVGIFDHPMPVYALDDVKTQWMLQHSETLRPLGLNTPVSIKVHSRSKRVTGK